jgi:hypothetical protein
MTLGFAFPPQLLLRVRLLLRAQTHKEPDGNGVVFDVMSLSVASSRRTGVWQNAPVVNPGYIPKQSRAPELPSRGSPPRIKDHLQP